MAFSPEEISQILEAFFKVVGTRQYIGARYVPLFGRRGESSIVWDNSAPYEPLTIVLYQGNSFTSRQYVPEGVDINNTEFWAETGNYNGQVEQYRRETMALAENVQDIQDIIDSYDYVTPEQYGAVPDGVTDCTQAIQAAINTRKTVLFNSKTYVINSALTIDNPTTIIGNKNSKLNCNACNCFKVNSGKVTITGLYVECLNNNGNTFIEIGSNDAATYGIELSYLHVSNFSNGIVEYRCWQLNVNNCYFSLLNGYGLHAINKSVNNIIDNTQFICNNVGTAIAAIFFDAQNDVSEGWMISNSLLYGFQYGIKAMQTSHIELVNNIIDYCDLVGIELNSVSTNNSLGWIVNGNYIAGTQDMVYGIHDNNQSAQATPAFRATNVYVNNKILKYTPNTEISDYGIYIEVGSNNAIVSNNTMRRFTRGVVSKDEYAQTIITNNACLSVGTKGCTIDAQGCIVSNNQSGYSSNLFIEKIGSMQIVSPINTTVTPLNDLLDICNVGDIVNYRTTTPNNSGLYRVTNESGTKQLKEIAPYVRKGSVNWSVVDHPDYLDVTYDAAMVTANNHIDITVMCTQKITYTLSNITKNGFRINIWDKPSGANATFIWKV